jgi:hypothetical protein
VHVLNVVEQAGQGPRILVSVAGPAVDQSGIAEGMSGSPVYCMAADGTSENIGAISEGVGQYGNNVGLVTPIEQMLGEPVLPPPSVPELEAKPHPLIGPLTVTGLSSSLMSVLEQAGRRVGRTVVAAPAAPAATASFPPQPLIPGAAVAASYSSGDIATGAIGTVTYRSGQDVYLFGHELDGAGRRSLLLQDAYVYGVVSNPDPTVAPSYKLAASGTTMGTVTSDTPNAVIGEIGPPPAVVPVIVTAHDLDTGRTIVERTQVADETAVGFPLGTSLLDTVAPLAIGQGAIDVYNGPPANESGSMCLTIALREAPTPLRFCNRYVGTGAPGDNGLAPPEISTAAANDVTSALSLLDEVQFATLHVSSVTADIRAERGLAEAQILGAHAPRIVSAGRRATVRVRIQLYRGKTQTIGLRIRVPRHPGFLPVTIRGGPAPAPPSSMGANNLTAALSLALGGSGPGPSGPPPDSLKQLRKQFASIASYDGLDVRYGHGGPKHLYRDPALLITGSAELVLVVRR